MSAEYTPAVLAADDPRNPNAVPDLDEWGFDSYWSAAQWIQWHQALKQTNTLADANVKFITEWQKQGFGAAPLDARSFDSSFRAYARENGFLDALYSGLGALARPLGTVTDVGDGIAATGGLVRSLLPLALFALVAWYALPLVKKHTATA